MRYRISFDTAEKAATPQHDCGVWHIICDESEVMEKTEAIAKIGFTPTVTMEVTDE